MDPEHQRVADIGLRAAERFGFALAGGYAVQAHGIIDRPSDDIDLFTAWERREEFATAVAAVASAFLAEGYEVEVLQEFETFARLAVIPPGAPERRSQIDLAANWRLRAPIRLEIGPVLHPDDVAAGKMSALFTRAEPRDFLDVDALVTSGRYSRDQLCELAAQTDGGFSESVLAELLGMLDRYPDRRFLAYEADAERIEGLRARFAQWRRELLDSTTAEQD